MAKGRKHFRDAGRARRRGLGRGVTERARGGLDELDFPVAHVSISQPVSAWTLDESDADVEAVVDRETQEDHTPAATEEGGDIDDTPRPREHHLLPELIGSRSPTVLLRLIHEEGQVRTELLVEPTATTADALEELQAFVMHCFQPDRKILTRVESE